MEQKSRSWSFILYEDSAPENWKEIIEKWFIPVSISPLHDRDIKTDTGELKKPHRHIIISFKSPTTYKNALSYAQELGFQYIERVGVLKSAYEYQIHKNNPEKAQYNEEDIINLNGFNAELREDPEEIEEKKREIIHIINEKNYTELKSIYDYCDSQGLSDYCKIIHHNTVFINAYLKSKKFMVETK